MEDKDNIRGALNSSDISLGKIYLAIKAAQEAKQEQTVHQVWKILQRSCLQSKNVSKLVQFAMFYL